MQQTIIKSCDTCKGLGDYYCNGCNKIFCQYHTDEHRQSFYDQLDWLTVDHDDLINTLDNNLFIKEKNHQSKIIIDQWEEESIKNIRQTANEARHALTDAIQTQINNVKDKLKILIEKFNSIFQNNNILFDERNLKQWSTELQNLKHEFLTTPKFTVRIHGNKPVVMPIIKIQPEPIYENLPNPQQQQQTSFGLIPISREKSISRTSLNDNSNTEDRFYFNSDHVKILDNGQVILHDSTKTDASIRGLNEYSKGEHKLFFRIEQMTSNQRIFFGIISKNASFNHQAYMNSSAYGWTGYNNIYINGKSTPVINGYVNEIKNNDFIELTINCDKQMIYFWHSRQNYKRKISVDIQMCPFPWQFLINCHNANDSIRILPSSMDSIIKRQQKKLNDDIKIKEIEL